MTAEQPASSGLEIELSQRLETFRDAETGHIGLSKEDATRELKRFLLDYYRKNSTSRAIPGAGVPGSNPSTLIEALAEISERSEGHLWNFDSIKEEIDKKRSEELSRQREIDRKIDSGGRA